MKSPKAVVKIERSILDRIRARAERTRRTIKTTLEILIEKGEKVEDAVEVEGK